MAPQPVLPLCTFGVITDIHCADVADSYNFNRTRLRYHRAAAGHVSAAAVAWTRLPVQFVLQLGDAIDGRFNQGAGERDAALKTLLAAFGEHRLYHVWGNHDLCIYSRAQLFGGRLDSTTTAGVTTPRPGHTAYYTFVPVAGFRIVVIDTFAFSVLGHDRESDVHVQASRFLRERNRNENWNAPDDRDNICFVKFNGAVGEQQLQWLDGVLQTAEAAKEKVLVIGN